jgi:thiamine-monophosphate kinase
LLTCDPVVEGIHYLPSTPPYRVGWKAMARNLSDIAAMAGVPRYAVVSIGLRPNTTVRYVEQLYAGMHAVAGKFGCRIVGGDTTHVKREQFIVVTMLGEAAHPILRTGSKIGDSVFVTGTLGGSLAGKHLTFTPRIAEGRWLTRHFNIHAMIDLSDGLGSDAFHLLEGATTHPFPSREGNPKNLPSSGGAGGGFISSRIGIELYAAEIPANDTLRAALYDGEDYELLFTLDPRDVTRLRRKWKFPLKLTEIGRVVRGRGVRLDGRPLTAKGYDHFQKRR